MFAAASKTASSSAALYVEDVFSTYIYTGNGSTQTITNGIDLSGKGGMVWLKDRSALRPPLIYDTVRGVYNSLRTDDTGAQQTFSTTLTAFNSNGFSVGSDNWVNTNSESYVSWVFEKQPKFFDVVTYTGNGGTLAVSHSLASTPGCVFVKRINSTSDWVVGHRGNGSYWASETLRLNTVAGGTLNGEFNAMSDTTVTVVNSGPSYGDVNTNGATYVMYLFAHNAGGFGALGTDNVISCGSFTTDGSGYYTVNLGYEPQFVLMKRTSGASNWFMVDTMRGFVNSSLPTNDRILKSNSADAETGDEQGYPTATGFSNSGVSAGLFTSSTYIYIAVRRGPMKTPTSGTSVFDADVSLNASFPYAGTTFPVDMVMFRGDRSALNNWNNGSRITGGSNVGSTNGGLLRLNLTNSEVADTSVQFDSNVGSLNWSGANTIIYSYRRAPSFMDVVCYTGTGTNVQAQPHNLGVAPELIIIKTRSNSDSWFVGANLGASTYSRLFLESSASAATTTYGSGTVDLGAQPTATNFFLGTELRTNGSGRTYIAYLFASCPGVSKVGSYTGTSTNQTINCGFPVRFVLIKRTDGTADWWVWDTARGMVAGTDPRLTINTTNPEANSNWVFTDASGFQLVDSNVAINTVGGNYIYLAIA